MTRKQSLRLIALLLICLAFSLVPHTAQAQGLPTRTFKVDTFEDLYDNVQDRSCASLSGKCSLRAAVTEAGIIYDGTPAFVHIKLPPGVYTLSLKTPPFAGSSEVHYGDLDLPGVDELTTPNEVLIEGTGGPGNPSIIDANYIDRVLELGERRKLTLRNLVIKNGWLEADSDAAASGGGIALRAQALLNLQNVRLTYNETHCTSDPDCTFSSGGAILSENANLSLFNVELDHNSADFGSAIYFWDAVGNRDFSIERSAIHHNLSQTTAIAGKGSLYLTHSSMAENDTLGHRFSNIEFDGTVWIQKFHPDICQPLGKRRN